ncbi:MAG TPA: VanZ family protein [Candidatus Eisenbacteria bacterium]|nr:VanZ family protein [Candidatus Eisenbacteria bacterium]
MTPERPRGAERTRGSLRLAFLAALYLAFLAYGSFVPLHFTPRPLPESWAIFQHAIPERVSRTDLAANFLLMVPFAFLLLGALPIARSGRTRLLAAAAVWTLASVLSAMIEFAQLYFPPRNPSLYDIALQSGGAAAGALAWLWGGPAIAASWSRWRTAYGAPALAEWILGPYLAVLFFYNVMPLDLTASPADVHEKWQQGRVVLVPFARLPDQAAPALFSILGDVAVWIPVAALLVLSGRTAALRAFLLTVLIASGIEGIQLLVFSRVSDVTDVITAAMGAAAGAWLGTVLGRRWGALARERERARGRSWALAGIAAAGLWLVVIAAVFWYPFDFHLDRAFARERLELLKRPLFQAYWIGSEFRAITEVFHKTIFFAPLGAALAVAVASIRGRRPRVLATAGAFLVLAAAALAVELGQVFLPGKSPDLTDALLMIAGGTLGLLGLLAVRERLLPRAGDARVAEPPEAVSGSSEA